MKYKKNIRKKGNLIKFIIVIILFITIVWLIPNIVIKNMDQQVVKRANLQYSETINGLEYNIIDLIKVLQVDNTYAINVNLENNITYSDNIELNASINEYSNDFKYNVQIFLNNSEILSKEIFSENETIPISLQTEGKNEIKIKVTKDDVVEYEEVINIYYIKPYEKQYLDELSNKGIQVHYRQNNKWEDYNKSIPLIKAIGAKYLRADLFYSSVNKGNQDYNFTYYDEWINQATNNGLNIILEFNGFTTKDGESIKFDTEEEFNEFETFINQVIERYPQISNFEILNEPNFQYTSEEDVKNYSKLVELANNSSAKNKNTNIIAGALAQVSETTNTESMNTTDFFNKLTLFDGYKNSSAYSYHPYDGSNLAEQNPNIKKYLAEYKNLFNDYGGFLKNYVTEYGFSTYKENNEETQADKLVQQSVLLDYNDVDLGTIYNFWNIGTDKEAASNNYGIVNYDYTPKPAYYSLKNYYENTNGSEYIGTINLADGLEAHIYDKDGKPKIITWSNIKDQTIQIDYANFTAKDLYGNDIENTNGKLDITTSPVYLDNISTKYFYEAISNTALEKYSEFEEKFATEIASVDGLQENINTLKQYLESISNIEKESEETAKQKMKEHFDLGNQILTAYKEKELDVEYVKLSSMLDMLNEIGDSFEDLVTVTAKTRNPDLENTKTLIDNTEQAINNNNDLDIVYPEKILEFSKELYEDSEYINSLEEENDIKTGLIVSYDLHAKYLADWANTFTNLYIDKYIEDNPVTESYSATSLTNQDVTVTLNIPQDVKITNNEGNNTYTFTENGTFTFEYERRGKTDSKLVSVNYIDKTPPEITNVENGEVYTQSITPNASDEHLDKVQLTFKGQVIEDYEVGDELAEEGEYKLTATDIVGNTSTVKFYIMKEDSTYKIKDSNILNIRPETTVKDFKENFTVIEGYTIKREDTELTDEDVISTGDVLEETDGNKFTLIVRGDLNCDGRLSLIDLSIGRKYLLGIIDIDEVQKLSSDMNTDEETSLMDLSIMRKTILGIIK